MDILFDWPKRLPVHYSVNAVLRDASIPMTNDERLEQWKRRWRLFTGNEPVGLYSVAFCRTCNKPHWFNNAKHRHLTARCEGH